MVCPNNFIDLKSYYNYLEKTIVTHWGAMNYLVWTIIKNDSTNHPINKL